MTEGIYTAHNVASDTVKRAWRLFVGVFVAITSIITIVSICVLLAAYMNVPWAWHVISRVVAG